METLIEKLLKKLETIEKSIDESSDIFSMFNQQSATKALSVDVEIKTDDETDSIIEGGEDTVYGQGTNPKPEDETYLNLLKNTSPKPKNIIIKTDK